MSTLGPDELQRYARHIVLREVGGPGQARLKAASVLVIGAGGLGSPALMYLAAAGVGRIGIVDDDDVSLSNLQRQIVHMTDRVGTAKTQSAADMLAALNPHVDIEQHAFRLTEATLPGLIERYDLVLDGCDNFDTRYLANAAAVAARVPLISAAITQWEGQISLYAPHLGGPCYACVFPQAPADGLAPSCAEAGVMGALAGIVGSMMAAEAIKVITEAGTSLLGRLMVHDVLYGENRTIEVARRADCTVCRAVAQ